MYIYYPTKQLLGHTPTDWCVHLLDANVPTRGGATRCRQTGTGAVSFLGFRCSLGSRSKRAGMAVYRTNSISHQTCILQVFGDQALIMGFFEIQGMARVVDCHF